HVPLPALRRTDVPRDRRYADGLASRSYDRRERHRHVDPAAVLADDRQLTPRDATDAQVTLDLAKLVRSVIGAQQQADAAPDHFARRVPEEALRAGVPGGDDPAIRREAHDCVVGGLHHRAETREL